MSQPARLPPERECERLNPGASADPPQRNHKLRRTRGKRHKNDAALPSSQNADLRGARRDRTARGATA